MAKIEKIFNKKKGVFEYCARFELGGETFRPKALTRKVLLETIDELRARSHRTKFDLPVVKDSPQLSELFDKHKPKIEKPRQRRRAERAFDLFLAINGEDIKISELKRAHFQKYIDYRLAQKNKKTGRSVLCETIDKEIYPISTALKNVWQHFPELDDYRKPEIPRATPKGTKKRKRERVVSKDGELDLLLAELRRDKTGKQTHEHIAHRRRLADDLEFRYETGLRRIESARLKKQQYFRADKCLRRVKRFKTGTVTKFLPLSSKAVEIIERRLGLQRNSEYIFSKDGEPNNADYRTLESVCAELGIAYGRYTEDGFIPHDLRHSFGSDLIPHTDIKTAQEFLGHSNIQQTFDYLHTNEDRMREAMSKREGVDKRKELVEIYKQTRRRRITAKMFVEKLQNLMRF